MEIDKDELLVKIKDTLKGEVSSISYDTWISSLGIKSIDENNIVFTTLSEYQRDFIENRFKDLMFNTINYKQRIHIFCNRSFKKPRWRRRQYNNRFYF